MGVITVVGLGPGAADLTTGQTRSLIRNAKRLFARTLRHPAASLLEDLGHAVSFDDVYERAETLADVYRQIRDRLIAEAAEGEPGFGDLVYAVPGSPLVLERSVELLLEAQQPPGPGGGLAVEVLPAVSFLDAAWAALGIDPVEHGVRLIDGRQFAAAAAGAAGPLLVAQCDDRSVLSDIKLALEAPPPEVTVLARLGLPDERVFEVAWADLDREVQPDHLTSVYIGERAASAAVAFERFEALVATLRESCPWDREQTHGSLRRHLLEEAHETLEALDARAAIDDSETDDELDTHLCEELGDLLYQVFFHARLAAERGSFSAADVAEGIHDKLVLRHPHVFGDTEARDSAAVLGNWEKIKAAEKGRNSSMDGISAAQPALIYALKATERAVSAGIDPTVPDGESLVAAADRLAGREASVTEGALGDLLFAAVRLARSRDLDPEASLRDAVGRFAAEVRAVEEARRPRGGP